MREQRVDTGCHVWRADRVLHLIEVIDGGIYGIDLQLLRGTAAISRGKIVSRIGECAHDDQSEARLQYDLPNLLHVFRL